MRPTLKQRMKRLEASLIREDGRLERVCAHGVGHTVGHVDPSRLKPWMWVHGCDGCCREYEREGV